MSISKAEIIKISQTPEEILKLNNNEVSRVSDKTDEQVVELQNMLTSERDSRKVERFVWTLCVAMLMDCLILPGLPGGVMTLVVLLEMVLLIILANLYNIEIAVRLLDKIWNKIGMN